MPAGLPESSFVAKFPSVATSFGSMSSICRKRWGSQAAISSGSGIAVPGRPALEHVRDEDVGAREPDPLEQPVEQLPRLTHERNPLLVLVEARRLADEHQVGVRAPGAEDDLRAPAASAHFVHVAVCSAYSRSAAARSTASIEPPVYARRPDAPVGRG